MNILLIDGAAQFRAARFSAAAAVAGDTGAETCGAELSRKRSALDRHETRVTLSLEI